MKESSSTPSPCNRVLNAKSSSTGKVKRKYNKISKSRGSLTPACDCKKRKNENILPDNLADFIIENEAATPVLTEEQYDECLEILCSKISRRKQLVLIHRILGLEPYSAKSDAHNEGLEPGHRTPCPLSEASLKGEEVTTTIAETSSTEPTNTSSVTATQNRTTRFKGSDNVNTETNDLVELRNPNEVKAGLQTNTSILSKPFALRNRARLNDRRKRGKRFIPYALCSPCAHLMGTGSKRCRRKCTGPMITTAIALASCQALADCPKAPARRSLFKTNLLRS